MPEVPINLFTELGAGNQLYGMGAPGGEGLTAQNILAMSSPYRQMRMGAANAGASAYIRDTFGVQPLETPKRESMQGQMVDAVARQDDYINYEMALKDPYSVLGGDSRLLHQLAGNISGAEGLSVGARKKLIDNINKG
jgi:hypothetical protein